MDERFEKAIADFITQRMDDHGLLASPAVDEAIGQYSACFAAMEQALTEAQKPLWVKLENALCLQVGEETRYYYEAGFRDAIRFLWNWREKP